MNRLQERLVKCEEEKETAFMLCVKDTLLSVDELQDLVDCLVSQNIPILAYRVTQNIKEAFKTLSKIKNTNTLQLAIIIDFQKIYHYGTKQFIEQCKKLHIEGIRILNLPLEEQGQVAVYLLDEDSPALLQEITPVSGDRIPQILKYARGCVWCSCKGDTSEIAEFGNPLEMYMYAVEATALIPVMLDFEELSEEQIQEALPFARGLILEKDLEQQIQKNGYSADTVHQYCNKIKTIFSKKE